MDGIQREFYNEKRGIAQTRVGVTTQVRLTPKMVPDADRMEVHLRDVRSCSHLTRGGGGSLQISEQPNLVSAFLN